MSLIVSAPKKKAKQSPYTYAWVLEPDGSFTLRAAALCLARLHLSELRPGWRIAAKMNGEVKRGDFESLEDAAKAVDRLLYKNFPHVWTVTDARVIVDPWRGDLNFEEI
jgi:hypothetical protein